MICPQGKISRKKRSQLCLWMITHIIFDTDTTRSLNCKPNWDKAIGHYIDRCIFEQQSILRKIYHILLEVSNRIK